MKQVTIVDYGIGNLESVQNAFEYLGAKVVMANSPCEIIDAPLLVLPGVGAFADGINELISRNLVDVIKAYSKQRTTYFGLCFGSFAIQRISRILKKL